MKVLIVLNSAWNLLNFRSGLIKALIAQGYEVVLAAPEDNHVPALKALGASFVDLPMRPHSINPLSDLKLLWNIVCLFKSVRPTVTLTYTVKPNVYGGLAARMVKVPIINNISGLGSVFIKDGWVSRVLSWLYREALARSICVFFQNPDDLHQFVNRRTVRSDVASLLPGSGIDLQRFQLAPLPCLQQGNLPNDKRRFVFLLVARILKDKGIREYAEAAQYLKPIYPQVEFALLGSHDQDNPNSISNEDFEKLQSNGSISYWGSSTDVRVQLALADCVVLPSYREGTPRSLLEAAAMGRPLIATDVPGCREVVQSGLNGLLCEVQNSKNLAFQMEIMLNMTSEQLKNFARASRELVQQRFDESFVIGSYINIIKNRI